MVFDYDEGKAVGWSLVMMVKVWGGIGDEGKAVGWSLVMKVKLWVWSLMMKV